MGSRVLITGGTGTFGKAMTRHLLKETDHTVCILSRDEHKQEVMAREFSEHADRLRFFIGDIRDKERTARALRKVTNVFHAAALKVIPSCEYNVSETIATNVRGTENLVDLCAQSDTITKFLLISTDKAVMPINAYGMAKALAEKIVTSAPHNYGNPNCVFGAIRLGNVIGSTGSVIPIWRKQLAENGRVTITDPEVTRFWMSVDEAVALIDNTIETMQGGEFAIPTLPSFRLGDLAAAMDAGYDVTSLPEWEKVHEGMSDMNRSDNARRMSVEEIRERLKEVG